MNILVICQYYYPENFQINDICEELVKRGHKVTVLTGLPNYPTGVVSQEYKKGRRRKEIINGVTVIRCYEMGRKRGTIGLGLNYLSYCLSAKIKVNTLKEKYNLVFVYQLSPVLMGIPGCEYKKKNKVPMLLYCCDLWPESMKLLINNEKSMLFCMMKIISTRIYRTAEKIIVQTACFYPYFKQVHKIPNDKLAYLPQFSNEDYLSHNYQLDNGIVDFVFLGNIGIAQNINKIIEAVELIRNFENFQLHIVGDGTCLESLQRSVKKKALQSKIVFYGRRPVNEMPEFYKLADACLVSLNGDNLTGLTLPSKVQGYMAAGKIVVGMANGAVRKVIEASGCGCCVPAGDSVALAKVMQDIIENPDKYKCCGENGRSYFKANFTKNKFIDSLETIMKETVSKNVSV